jgi:hypothetical protein
MGRESTAMDENRVAPAIKEVRGAPEDAIGRTVSDGVGHKVADKKLNYTSSLNDTVRDAEAMMSAGALVASPVKTGP